MSGEDEQEEGYIVEFTSIGKSLKVTAIDPVTGKEVSIVGDRKASHRDLSQLAVRKLKYVLERDREE